MAHARHRAEPLQKVAVEDANLPVPITGLSGVQLEQQHVLAIEADLDRLQQVARFVEKIRLRVSFDEPTTSSHWSNHD